MEANAGVLRLHVDDDGPGIAPEHRARVFYPFVRLAGARQGRGLGLALVERVITLHRGTVAVVDCALGGARFTVELPSDCSRERMTCHG